MTSIKENIKPPGDPSSSSFTVDALNNAAETEIRQFEKEKEKETYNRTNMKEMSAQWMKMGKQAEEKAKKENEKLRANQQEALKKTYLYQIGLYMERFPFLKEKIPLPSVKNSLEELQQILYLVRMEMNAQNSAHRIKAWVDRIFLMIDKVWGDGAEMTFLPPPLRLNLKGISQLESNGAFDEDLMPLILEYDIEYPWIGRQNLTFRTIESLAGIAMKVHLYNTNPAAKKILNLEKQPPIETEEDLKNL